MDAVSSRFEPFSGGSRTSEIRDLLDPWCPIPPKGVVVRWTRDSYYEPHVEIVIEIGGEPSNRRPDILRGDVE